MTNATPLPEWMNDRLVKRGTWKGVEWVLARGGIRTRINGYVYLPEGHPWRTEDDFYAREDIDAHGGLTYGDKDGWIGFDTAHGNDSWGDDPEMDAARADNKHLIHWTEALVLKEVRRLAAQVATAEATPAPPVLPADAVAAKDAAWGEWEHRYGDYYANSRKAFAAGFDAAYVALTGASK